jgi:hypothetical protein
MSLTSGAMWGPHNEGFHLTLTLWVDKVTEAQSGREYVREVRQPHIDPRSRLSFFIGSSTSSQYRRGSSSTLIICHPPHSTSGLDLATRVCFCSIPLTLFLSLSFCSFSFAERASLGHAPLPGTAAGVYIHALCSLMVSQTQMDRHQEVHVRVQSFVQLSICRSRARAVLPWLIWSLQSPPQSFIWIHRSCNLR